MTQIKEFNKRKKLLFLFVYSFIIYHTTYLISTDTSYLYFCATTKKYVPNSYLHDDNSKIVPIIIETASLF